MLVQQLLDWGSILGPNDQRFISVFKWQIVGMQQILDLLVVRGCLQPVMADLGILEFVNWNVHDNLPVIEDDYRDHHPLQFTQNMAGDQKGRSFSSIFINDFAD